MNKPEKDPVPEPVDSRVNDPANVEKDSELDLRIEQTLNGLFTPSPIHESHVDDLRRHIDERTCGNLLDNAAIDKELRSVSSVSDGRLKLRRRWLVVASSLAASGLIAAGWLGIHRRDRPDVVFRPQPLATVYRAMVRRGFEPYYICDDLQRFENVIAHRHGQPLTLTTEGNELMVGLSYPGGWTPETTAILFRLSDVPLVVFVDHESNIDERVLAADGLTVRRKRLNELMLIEVSPADQSVLGTIRAVE